MREFAECTSSFLWELYIQHITHRSIHNPSIKVLISRDFSLPLANFFLDHVFHVKKSERWVSPIQESTPGESMISIRPLVRVPYERESWRNYSLEKEKPLYFLFYFDLIFIFILQSNRSTKKMIIERLRLCRDNISV